MIVSIQREPDALDLPLPAYATDGAAGLDLRAAVEGELTLAPGTRVLVSTGVRVALPEGYEGQVRPRSGLALEYGLTLLNSPGTIDSDYRGIVKVILVNLGQGSVTVQRGDRIAQIIIAPVTRIVWTEAAEMPGAAERGEQGFGSTGK